MSEYTAFFAGITDDDDFMDMPLTAQALFFHLAIDSDKDGICYKPKAIVRMIGASDGDLEILRDRLYIEDAEKLSGAVKVNGAGGLENG